jgi:cell division protein FtsI (penicillin-binding protein 3)
MRLVVEHGTGRKASVPGYLVGGKTGTAEKVSRRGYKKKALISSFVAAFPMNKPRYVVLAMLEEAKGTRETFGFATGGWVAAPVVGAVVRRIAPVLGLRPIVDLDAAQKALSIDITAIPGRGRRLASH